MIIGYVIMDAGGTPLIKEQLVPLNKGRGDFLPLLLSVLNQLSGEVIDGDIECIQTSGQQLYMQNNENTSVVIISDVKNEALHSLSKEILDYLEEEDFRIEELEFDFATKKRVRQQCRQIISERFPEMQVLTEYDGAEIPESESKALKLIENDIGEVPDIEVEDQSVTSLNLGNTDLSDLSPLPFLFNLTRLNLHGTPISDLSPLTSLTNLKELDLGNTEVTDVTPLKHLKNLEVVKLGNTEVTDIAPLKTLEHLKEVKLNMGKITDLSPLLELEDLQRVTLWYTEFSASDESIAKLREKGVEVKL